jgi:hypothetical protein
MARVMLKNNGTTDTPTCFFFNKFGYVQTGKKYGVSDNTIRKWIKIGSLAK